VEPAPNLRLPKPSLRFILHEFARQKHVVARHEILLRDCQAIEIA
jgi:hypothetical protein